MEEKEVNRECTDEQYCGANTVAQGFQCLQASTAHDRMLMIRTFLDIVDGWVLDTFHRDKITDKTIGYVTALKDVRDRLKEAACDCEISLKHNYVSSYEEKEFMEYVLKFECKCPEDKKPYNKYDEPVPEDKKETI